MASTKKQGKGAKVTAHRKGSDAKVPPAAPSYAVVGDDVTWNGPAFLSWHDVANNLSLRDCIAVLLAAHAAPFPLGAGAVALAECRSAAIVAVHTIGGRQLDMFENRPFTKFEAAANEAFVLMSKEAARAGVSLLGALRLMLAIRSNDRCNAPVDSYMRLAAGTLGSY